MGTLAHAGWLHQALRRLPAAWVAALDAWSYGVAVKHRQRRKEATLRRRMAPIAYQLKPWRD